MTKLKKPSHDLDMAPVFPPFTEEEQAQIVRIMSETGIARELAEFDIRLEQQERSKSK